MARMYIHVRRRGRMRQVRGGRWVRERENRRAYDEWSQTDRQTEKTRRAAAGCIRHHHNAAHAQLDQTALHGSAAHTAQADRFDIRKRSGWLVFGR